ncbi:MAG: dihydroorotate dehydrogenase-like protein [Myxococcales bacterium]|nr:dihydroorotate dehydrogenase-like protein [Myxococcales bacterium]
MDLKTKYLGFELSNPFMPGASPLLDSLDVVRRLEDAGAAALVMRSLFEEQIDLEAQAGARATEEVTDVHAEALSFFPRPDEFALGGDQYLEQLRKIAEAVKVPVIASLNGTTPSGWLRYARMMEQAGARALELNLHHLSTDVEESGEVIEKRLCEVVRTVRASVKVPISVKLSPFFSSLPHMVRALGSAGADGFVLFNRFYQPDIDIDALEAVPTLHLSDSSELLLRLRWLAILYGHAPAGLAVSGGVHTTYDAVKAVMAGASAVQVVSALLRHGPGRLRALREDFERWMVEKDYESVTQMRGSMSLARCPDPAAFERANYMRILQSFRVRDVPV